MIVLELTNLTTRETHVLRVHNTLPLTVLLEAIFDWLADSGVPVEVAQDYITTLILEDGRCKS